MSPRSRAAWAVMGVALFVGAQGSSAGFQREQEAVLRPACTEWSLRGSYGIQTQGTRPAPAPAAPGTIETVIGLIVREYDGRGGFTQINNEKGSVSGLGPADRAGSGTYQVNEDCSGSHELHIPGVPVTITDRFVIIDQGREIRHFVVNPAPVMVTGVAQRMSSW